MSDPKHRLSDFFYDKYVKEATRIIEAHNRDIAPYAKTQGLFCKAGCAACCATPFFNKQAEIDAITGWVIEHPEVLDGFLARLPARLAAIREHAELYEQCKDPGPSGGEKAVEFLRLGIPCAFLDPETSLCTIYAVRPLVCAAFVSIVPARFCATDPKSTMSRRMAEIYQASQAELDKLQKKYKVKGGPQLDISMGVAARLQDLGLIRMEADDRVTRLD